MMYYTMSKPASQPEPNTALPLLRHLCNFGESTSSELIVLRGQGWVQVLEKCGAISLCKNGDANSSLWLLLLGEGSDDRNLLRQVFFRVPAYRRRLVAILAYGLVDAAQKDLLVALEGWVARDISPLAGEINDLLNALELDGINLVALPPEKLLQRFMPLFTGPGDAANWDQLLLGQSGEPQHLFEAVLEKFGKADVPVSLIDGKDAENYKLALLPDFSLTTDDCKLPTPVLTPWTTARRRVHSSLALFEASGRPLFDSDLPVEIIWQDALAQQPFYRVLIHLAYAHRLGIGEKDQVQLFCDPSDPGKVYIERHSQIIGHLADFLPNLVEKLGYYPVWSPADAFSRVEKLISNLIATHILAYEQDHLVLAENYALSLNVPPRAAQIGRGQGRVERQAILAALQPTSIVESRVE